MTSERIENPRSWKALRAAIGMNLFVINAMAGDVPMARTFAGAFPFVITDLVRVTILVAAPVLTLGLVRAVW